MERPLNDFTILVADQAGALGLGGVMGGATSEVSDQTVSVLLEGAGGQGWIDLVFGLTEGWWRFADREVRPDYPLPSRAGWRSS